MQLNKVEATPASVNTPYRPGVAEQLGTQYVTNRAVSKDGWIDKGWDYGSKKVGEGVDYAKTNMSSNPPPTSTPLSTDAQNVADLAVTENSPTAGMVPTDVAAPLSASATEAVAAAPIELTGEAIVGEVAQTGLTEAGVEAVGTEALGSSAGAMAGPLAGVATYMKTGDEKKAIGSGAGAYAGAIAGSAFGPVGTFIGSALGSYIGSSLF